MTVEATKLEPWFLHEDLAVRILGAAIVKSLPFVSPSHPFAASLNHTVLAEALWTYISDESIASGAAEILAGRLRPGHLVWFDEPFWFRNVAKSYHAGGTSRALLHTKLDVDASVRVSGHFNAGRITASTSLSILTGRPSLFVLAYVLGGNDQEVELRPVIIASRLFVNSGGFDENYRDRVRLWPSQIDQLRGVDFDTTVRKSDLKLLRDVTEDVVKRAFAEIIGESEVPKDWGGEQFDLWTDRMTVSGQRYQAAIAFKGPAKFHPMTLADLGKNGDQLDRLSNTAADLLVLQHCHTVTAPVINCLRTYAVQPGYRRRYLVIDGYDTVRILRNMGLL